MSKELVESGLLDVVPDSISKDPDVSSAAKALDVPLLEMTNVIDLPSIYVSIDKLTSDQLDHLAYSWDASVWRDSWPIELKRSIVKQVVQEKRKKGTRKAVEEAVEALGSAATIKEWWQQEPKGTPHTFTIFASLGKLDGALESEMQEDLIALINDAKPVRSHFDFVVVKNLLGRIGWHGSLRPVTYARIRSEQITSVDYDSTLDVRLNFRTLTEHCFIGVAR